MPLKLVIRLFADGWRQMKDSLKVCLSLFFRPQTIGLRADSWILVLQYHLACGICVSNFHLKPRKCQLVNNTINQQKGYQGCWGLFRRKKAETGWVPSLLNPKLWAQIWLDCQQVQIPLGCFVEIPLLPLSLRGEKYFNKNGTFPWIY